MAKKQKKKKKKVDNYHARKELLLQENDNLAAQNVGYFIGVNKLKDTKDLHKEFDNFMKGK